MSYAIEPGMLESELSAWLETALKKYGKYENGGVDYTYAEIAPIVMCTVTWNKKILLAKRGFGLADAEGYWSTINGFIDFDRPVTEIAAQEFLEELGLKINPKDIKVGESFTVSGNKEKRIYIVFPCLLILQAEPKIVLDREHTEYRWIYRNELEKFETLDDLSYVIDHALALI